MPVLAFLIYLALDHSLLEIATIFICLHSHGPFAPVCYRKRFEWKSRNYDMHLGAWYSKNPVKKRCFLQCIIDAVKRDIPIQIYIYSLSIILTSLLLIQMCMRKVKNQYNIFLAFEIRSAYYQDHFRIVFESAVIKITLIFPVKQF